MNKRIAAFKFAFEGVIDFFTNHYHPKIHLAFAIFAVTFAFILGFSAIEWCILLVCIGFVWVAEAMNTAIEYICNKITLQKDPEIKKVKDMAAGAVLMASCIVFIIGLLLFIPKIVHLINNKI